MSLSSIKQNLDNENEKEVFELFGNANAREMSPGVAKKSSVLLVAVVLGMTVSGCRDKTNRNGPGQTVRLGYFGNLTHAQAVLGVSSGEFARALLRRCPVRRTSRASIRCVCGSGGHRVSGRRW